MRGARRVRFRASLAPVLRLLDARLANLLQLTAGADAGIELTLDDAGRVVKSRVVSQATGRP